MATEVRLALSPGGTIEVETTARSGALRLLGADGSAYVSSWADGVAEYPITGDRTMIHHVAPGHYTVVRLDETGQQPVGTVAVIESQVTRVTLD